MSRMPLLQKQNRKTPIEIDTSTIQIFRPSSLFGRIPFVFNSLPTETANSIHEEWPTFYCIHWQWKIIFLLIDHHLSAKITFQTNHRMNLRHSRNWNKNKNNKRVRFFCAPVEFNKIFEIYIRTDTESHEFQWNTRFGNVRTSLPNRSMVINTTKKKKIK